MANDPFGQLNLAFQRGDNEKPSCSECLGTPGNIMNIKVRDGGGNDFFPLIINRMVDQSDVEVRIHFCPSSALRRAPRRVHGSPESYMVQGAICY
jgi:hypothetical protein